jgi:hypothetical protein
MTLPTGDPFFSYPRVISDQFEFELGGRRLWGQLCVTDDWVFRASIGRLCVLTDFRVVIRFQGRRLLVLWWRLSPVLPR